MQKGSKWCQAGKVFVATAGNSSPRSLTACASYFHQWTEGNIGLNFSINYKDLSIGISYTGVNGQEQGSDIKKIYK